jgi:hypothetical protein
MTGYSSLDNEIFAMSIGKRFVELVDFFGDDVIGIETPGV